jgi:hypothetical protein
MEQETMNQDLPLRWFLGWVGMIVGAYLGWTIGQICWHGGRIGHGIGQKPVYGFDYYATALICSVACAVLGLALFRWRDLPHDDSD